MGRMTNRYDLPEPIVRAVINDPYDPGDCEMTITRLIKPPRMVELQRLHHDQLEEDVSDRIWALIGQSIHVILERAETTALVEERFYVTRQGWRIGGRFDRLAVQEGLLQDFKVTSVNAIRNGFRREWEEQLNLLALLLCENGLPVQRLEAVAILRDWCPRHRESGEALCQVQRVEIPLWSEIRAEEFLDERIRLHQMSRSYLPECSPEERWASGDSWAVMKLKAKRATGVYQTEAEALEKLNSLDGDYRIEHRPGRCIRCESYCPARTVCGLV